MFKASLAILLVFTSYHGAQSQYKRVNITHEFRNEVAKRATTWKVKELNQKKSSPEVAEFFFGLTLTDSPELKLPVHYNNDTIELPESFDARERWPNCPTIREIRDQESCGSCWAFGAVEAMSDRICIHSNASVRARLSPRDLLTCCDNCLSNSSSFCGGGCLEEAWQYWVDSGIVTGGDYGSSEPGCRPYESDDCTKSYCKSISNDTSLSCKRQCIDSYPRTYSEDKYFGKSAYYTPSTEEQIKKEIFINGPVSAAMRVYQDFTLYMSGVYQHVYGEYVGDHAVKIIGWGVEKGTPYWLATNSWGTWWGEKGFFKILRGSNESKIEEIIVGGLPKF